jgi:hypothetical protein
MVRNEALFYNEDSGLLLPIIMDVLCNAIDMKKEIKVTYIGLSGKKIYLQMT